MARGAALITALLIVATVVALAAGMAGGQHLAIRRAANILDRDRAMQIALGGEGWAMGILARDGAAGSHDHLQESWTEVLPPVPVSGGVAAGRIVDWQGLFNLNNLVTNGRPNGVEVVRFERLLTLLRLDPGLAVAVVDWLDGDGVVGGMAGAEDETYLGKNPPYRAANQPFVSVSELRLVEGFDAAAVARLTPLVSVLPERTPLNVNTAPLELLMTLAQGVTREDLRELDEKRRRDEGFVDVRLFLAEAPFKDREVPSEGLSVASRYFLVESSVESGRGRVRLLSLLARHPGGVTVVRRGQGAL